MALNPLSVFAAYKITSYSIQYNEKEKNYENKIGQDLVLIIRNGLSIRNFYHKKRQ